MSSGVAYMVRMRVLVSGRNAIGRLGVGWFMLTTMNIPIPQAQKSENWGKNRPDFRDSGGAR